VPLAAEAQPVKAPRVGLLGLGSAEASPFFEALRQGLRERGSELLAIVHGSGALL